MIRNGTYGIILSPCSHRSFRRVFLHRVIWPLEVAIVRAKKVRNDNSFGIILLTIFSGLTKIWQNKLKRNKYSHFLVFFIKRCFFLYSGTLEELMMICEASMKISEKIYYSLTCSDFFLKENRSLCSYFFMTLMMLKRLNPQSSLALAHLNCSSG